MALLLSAVTAAAATSATRDAVPLEPSTSAAAWSQDEFWISFWVGPQVSLDELGPRVAEIAEANFTGYLGFNDPDSARVAREVRARASVHILSADTWLGCLVKTCAGQLTSATVVCV